MVAIVSGARPGLELGSLHTLGAAGTLGQAAHGRNGQAVFVNVATGGVVVQTLDDVQVLRGPDAAALRTYSSRGGFDGDNGDQWSSGAQWLEVAGVPNTAGSTVSRRGRDGSVATYSWQEGPPALYASSEGAGAHDTLSFVAATAGAAATFEWRDGNTGVVEIYEASGAFRILSARDAAGNTLTYGYNADGLLSSMTGPSGEGTFYVYEGRNLQQVSTGTASARTSRVAYGYDAQNRLASVTVDLTPADGSVADGNVYRTTYTYDGDSQRVASIAQSDGSSLSFKYVDKGGGAYFLETVTDALNRTTSFAYSAPVAGVARSASVTDAAGGITRYDMDASGNLSAITLPGAAAPARRFTYTAAGDVETVTDGEGRTTVFEYANGNQVLQRDAAGNTVTRTFDARNQLLAETTWLVADADGAGPGLPGQSSTARFVYDAAGRNQLRFEISADGRVTEHRYDGFGERVSTIRHAGASYTGTSAAEADLAAWAGAQKDVGSVRMDMTYDARGQLETRTTYATLTATGEGVRDGTQSLERFVRDGAGLLLQTVSARGGVTRYTYDGLGRLLTSSDPAGQVTVTRHIDTGAKTSVTLANGLVTTSSYDTGGRLVSVLQSTATSAHLGETRYHYDSLDRLRMVQDPTGVRTWTFHDAAGRKVGDIDGNGSLTEYVYDASDRLTYSVRYATAVATAGLVDASGSPVLSKSLADVRPAPTHSDVQSWRAYDAAGRLVRSAHGVGTTNQAAVTEYRYDGGSRLVQERRFATLVALPAQPVTTWPEIASTTQDRITRHFHTADGRAAATLDAEGFLTTMTYDAAGQERQRRAYATAIQEPLRSTGSLADLLKVTPTDADIVTSTFHDGKGQLALSVDGEGYATETVYDAQGNAVRTIQYATRAKAVGAGSTLASVRPDGSSADRVTTRTYDVLDRLEEETSPEGVVTRHGYDALGRLVSTTRAFGTPEARTLATRFDVLGRVTGELSAEGAALLTGGQTQAQVDAIWAQYGSTHTYDAAGRRTSTTDALGHTTWFYYDADAALTFTVNALGEVRENRYDTLGRLVEQVAYANRTTVRGPGGLHSAPIAITRDTAQDAVTRYTYTRDSRVATTTDAEANLTERSYNAFGDETASTRAISAGVSLAQVHTVDRRGLRTGTTSDPLGINASVSTVYDAFGRAVWSKDANGQVRQQGYDRNGRVVLTIDALAAERRVGYDPFGRKLTATDAFGHATTFAYDAASRSVSVTTPEGIRTTTTYNRHGEVVTVSDPKGQVTSHAYDRNGRLLRTTTPLTAESHAYDRVGSRIETVDANGTRVAYTYDAARRVLTRRVDPLGLNLTTQYQYDGKGLQVAETDPNEVTTRLKFDRLGRVWTRTVDPGGLNLVTTYTHDANGQVLTVTTPGGTVTQYVYDALGRRRLERVDPNGLRLERSWTYDGNGNVATSTDARGQVTRYAYDGENRLMFTVDPMGNLRMQAYDAEGRVVKTQAFATPIATAGLPAVPTPAAIQERIVQQPAQDIVEHRIHDRDGRLVATVDGTGAVVRYTHDVNGNVVARTAYANRVAGWVVGTLPVPVADAARDQVVRTVYDALNRATYTIDGTGGVVAQKYDGQGNVIERIAYATRVSPGTPATAADLSAAVAAIASPGRDAVVRNTFDAAGRLVYSLDGLGAVTRRSHDRNGNVVQQIAYATPIASGSAASSVVASASDRVESYAYDAANRLVFSVDALQGVTERVYDVQGQVVRQVAYATPIAGLPALGTSATVGAIRNALRPASADRSTRFGFDAAGRQALSIDAEGGAVETRYDGAGNVVARLAYATRANTSGLASAAGLAALRTTLSADAAADRLTQYAYDGAGRLVYETDAQRGVKQMRYDGIGQVTATVRYALALDAGVANSVADMVAGLKAHAADRREEYGYDASGRRIEVRFADGTDKYGYDALGQKTSFTNRRGATWTYAHDAAGRMVGETSPEVTITTTRFDGTTVVEAGAPAAHKVLTTFGYDALGNLTQRTEAAGLPEQRTTRYEYDALGRQVRVVFAPVGVYDEARDDPTVNNGLSPRVEVTRQLETRTYYDALGNAVANRDVGGALSQKVYDRAGRVLYEIDALGYVTGRAYDAFGGEVALTRLASRTALAARTVGKALDAASAADVQAALAAPGFDHARDRTLRTTYDRMGRAVEVSQPEAFHYDSATGLGFVASARTQKVYNAFGETVQEKRARDGASSWFTTTHYYDRLGRESASVDAAGHLTVRSHDVLGNVARVTEHATALAAGTWSLAGYAAAAASASDRTTTFTYDLLDRKTSETRVGVEAGMQTDGTAARVDLVTRYTYDAVGNQASVTDAGGETSWTWYDALGRVAATATPFLGSGKTLTRYMRDAHGNVVVQVEHATPTSANAAGFAAVADAGTDRVTRSRYDALGRVVEVQDANGAVAFTSYDAWGHAAKNWRAVTDADGVTRTRFEVNVYDAVGQLVESRAPASTSVVQEGIKAAYTPAVYNAEDGALQWPHKLQLAWSNLVETQGGNVRVEVDYLTPSTIVRDEFGTPVQGEPEHTVVLQQEFAAAAVPAGATVTWTQATVRVQYMRVSQLVAGQWVTKWEGSPANAMGSGMGTVSQAQAGLVLTQQEFNAFGELTRQGTQAGRQVYFDHDNAGRLWRTNSDGGVDKILLYDAVGNVTSEIRSSGSGGDNRDLKGYANAQAASADPYTRRVDTQYDAIGHVTSRHEAARLERQGGATVQRQFTTASVETAVPVGDMETVAAWSGKNKVTLGWNSLGPLGSGDVRVTLTYRTPITRHGGEMDADARYTSAVYFRGGDTRTRTEILKGEAAARGATLAWDEDSTTPYGGGVGVISWIRVEKKDVFGNWQPVIDQVPGYGANEIDIAAPVDQLASTVLYLRRAGEPGWTAVPAAQLVNFGTSFRYDARPLGPGQYEYAVGVALPGQCEETIATGTLAVTLPTLTAITAPLAYGPMGAGVLTWPHQDFATGQVFRYRPAGSTGAWNVLPVAMNGEGSYDGVDTTGVAPGSYEFELVWNAGGQGIPTSHAVGTFSVTAPVAGYDVPQSGWPHIDGVRLGSMRLPGTYTVISEATTTYVPGPEVPALVWNACNANVARWRVPGGAWNDFAIDTDARWYENGVLQGYERAALHNLPGGPIEIELLALSGEIRRATATYTVSPQVLTVTTPPYTPAHHVAALPAQYGVSVNPAPGPFALSTQEGVAMAQGMGKNGITEWLRPVVKQNTDRWGNVLSITDPRSERWVTTYRYNASNQMVQQTLPDAGAGAAVTSIFYDAMGRQVAVRDARGFLNQQVFDGAGNLAEEKHADGGIVRHTYDALGRKLKTVDATGRVVTYGYDRMGNLLAIDRGVARVYSYAGNVFRLVSDGAVVDRWTYDQLGQKIAHVNGNGEYTRYAYDLRGNVIETRQPLGHSTRMAYDAQGRKIAEVDAGTYSAYWTYDYFGLLLDHRDLGSARFRYTYDNARQLLVQTSTRGQRLEYAYDAAGQVIQISDAPLNKSVYYAYDASGRRILERTVQNGVTYQDNHLAYDAVGNLRDVADARVHLEMRYDKSGNRTYIGSRVDYQGVGGAAATATSFRHFQYDAMNRQTVVDAVDEHGNIGPGQGHLLAYDKNGNRIADTSYGKRIATTTGQSEMTGVNADGQAIYTTGATYAKTDALTTEAYHYDALNRLQWIQRDGVQTDLRMYDGADRVVRSGVSNLPAAYLAVLDEGLQPGQSNGAEFRFNRYDANGRLMHQQVMNSNGTEKQKISWDPTETLAGLPQYTPAGYDGAGNSLGYRVTGPGDISMYTTELERFDSHQVAVTTVSSTLSGWGQTQQGYDANGFLVRVDDKTLDTRDREFVNDVSGKALFVTQGGNEQRQLIVNGEALGIYGAGVDPKKPTADAKNNPNFANLADFNFSYAPISSSYPNASPGAYTVRPGETLQTIARSAYGDSALWYRIAEANGLQGNNDLKAGQTLNIPNRVSTIHNNQDTFKPYDPSRITGDLTPLPGAGNDEGCGPAGQMLMIIVTVIVTVWTAGALTTAMTAANAASLAATGAGYELALVCTAAAAAPGMAGNAVIMATASAVGSIVGQAVGLGTGAIQEFSWKQVGLAAVSGAVSGGVGDKLFGSGPVAAAGRAVLSKVVSQAISVALGLQERFDWRGVAAAAVGSLAASATLSALKDVQLGDTSFKDALARRTISGLAAGGAAALARGKRVDITQVVLDAFGNALGESFARHSEPEPSIGEAWRQEMTRRRAALNPMGLRVQPSPEWSTTDVLPQGSVNSTEDPTFASATAALKAQQNPMNLPLRSSGREWTSSEAEDMQQLMREVLDIAATPGRPSMTKAGQSASHYFLIGMVGRHLPIANDRIARMMAYSQWPDQVSALDAHTNGTRWYSQLAKEYMPALAGLQTMQGIHALNGLPFEQNVAAYLDIIRMHRNDDAVVGIALHALVDSVFHSRVVNGRLMAFSAPWGHASEGSAQDYVSPDQVRVASALVVKALEHVAGQAISSGGLAAVMGDVEDVMYRASAAADKAFDPKRGVERGAQRELSFRVIAAELLNSGSGPELLNAGDIQNPYFAPPITPELTVEQTRRFLSSGRTQVSAAFARRFAEDGMMAVETIMSKFNRAVTGRPFSFDANSLTDTKWWSVNPLGLFWPAPTPGQPWSSKHISPGFTPKPVVIPPGMFKPV